MTQKNVVHAVKSGKITMFIYTSLFLASLVVILFARFVWKAISSAYKAVSKPGKAVYRSNQRAGITVSAPGYRKHGKVRKTSSDALISLDQLRRAPAWDLAGTHASKPQMRHLQNAAWLLREEKPATFGKTYKVSRNTTHKPKTPDMVNRPWKREVAPSIQNPEAEYEDFRPANSYHDADV